MLQTDQSVVSGNWYIFRNTMATVTEKSLASEAACLRLLQSRKNGKEAGTVYAQMQKLEIAWPGKAGRACAVAAGGFGGGYAGLECLYFHESGVSAA